jgi:N-acetylglucosaminyl-diphospho-decaprenol L-rhamnosyltransferase
LASPQKGAGAEAEPVPAEQRPAEQPLVSIVAVNFNGASQVERYMQGVRGSDYGRLEVIVVDNASSDESAERFSAHPDVQVLRSAENLGYGRACNLGAQQASGELLLFMNPDVDLQSDTISVLVREWACTPRASVVCTTMIEEGHLHERRRYAEDVASMEAASMLVERSHFERLDGFDPWIFLYHEDNDLCYRTWLVGRRVLKAWDAVADHDVGGTGGGRRWSGQQIKNGLYVHLKLRGWRATARYAARMATKTVIRGVRLRDPAILTAWRDNALELPSTLAKRRAIRGAATPADLARLERLGAEHAYWARRSWWVQVRLGIQRRLAPYRRRTASAAEEQKHGGET